MSAPGNQKHTLRQRVGAGLHRFFQPFLRGVFLDIPYILDSAWRHTEYALNRTFSKVVEKGVVKVPRERPHWQQPAFWFFALTLLFAIFGPTFDAVCSISSIEGAQLRRNVGIALCYAAGIGQVLGLGAVAIRRSKRRFERRDVTSIPRQAIVYVALGIVTLASAYPWLWLAKSLEAEKASMFCMQVADPTPAWVMIGLFVVAVIAAGIVTSLTRSVIGRIFGETLILFLTVFVLWRWVAPEGATEAGQVPYKHLYAILAVALGAIASLFSLLLLRKGKWLEDVQIQKCQAALAATELFPGTREDVELTWRRVLASLALGILHYPLHVLLLPALFVVMSSNRLLWTVAILWTIASLLLVAMCNLTNTWQRLLNFVARWFLIGSPLIVSLAVIAIAILRLSGVQYVSTVLDVAPFGVLFFWIVMTYALFWWFEYHINAILGARVLEVLGSASKNICERVEYVPGAEYANSTRTTVDRTGRWLTSHSVGQIAVIGWFKDSRAPHDKINAFNTYNFADLFAALLGHKESVLVRDIERRAQLYFAGVNLCLILTAVVLGFFFSRSDDDNTVKPLVAAELSPDINQSAPPPTASAGLSRVALTTAPTTRESSPKDEHVDLPSLFELKEGQMRPALVIAASGGGTRAALYTAAGLEALGKLRRERDVVLLSGVSGGGVAAAYFYAHHHEFAVDDAAAREAAWTTFRSRMREPFISDVLEGAMEWRIFTDEPLSTLLAESFERRLFKNHPNARLGGYPDMGLVLNTTLTGHPMAFTALLGKSFTSEQVPTPAPADQAGVNCPLATRPLNNLSGGRLVFTNFHIRVPWDAPLKWLPDVRMPFVPVSDTGHVRLANAAALTANFPPVFPNARIDLYKAGEFMKSGVCPDSFFVTDGGATENLGLVSALFAVRSALDQLANNTPVREIHVVAFEASAFGYDYAQDRGLGAATGGSKERLTGALTLRLIEDINTKLKQRANWSGQQLHIHYLPLPTVFRSRGGFGTHWIAPQEIDLKDPRVAYLENGLTGRMKHIRRCGIWWWHSDPPCNVSLNREELKVMWSELFGADARFCTRAKTLWRKDGTQPSKDLYQVASWICGPDNMNDPPEGKSGDAQDDRQQTGLPEDFFISAWRDLVGELPPVSDGA